MDASRKDFGREAERLARHWLIQKGMTLVVRNWRCKLGEIDLVMMDGDTLCFVEVRAKATADDGHPLETITAPKRRRLARLAEAYLALHPGHEGPLRFDAVGIVGQEGRYEVIHVPDAFAWRREF